MFHKLDKSEKATAIIFLAAILTGLWLPARIIVSASASLDHRIFLITAYDKRTIKDGDYLVFRGKNSPLIRTRSDEGDLLFIKQVGCSPGETLNRNDNQFFCEKRPLGKALIKDSTGRSLPQFTFNGPIPEHSFFMQGTHPRSFDSKYFGFIRADEILHKALPLW